MIDTNAIVQAGQAAQEIKTQISPWLPAIAIAAAWTSREFAALCTWADRNVERIIAHGGLLKLICKFFYNSNP